MVCKDVIAVIRSVNERTTEFCRFLIKEQGVETLLLRNFCPVTKAIRNMYQSALESGKKWTLSVDADQLIDKGKIKYLYEQAESFDKNLYAIKGTVIDKLLLHLRGDGYGPILFRTSIFKKMLSMLPDPKKSMTPESYIMGKLNKEGYHYERQKEYIALHDFEQYYKDIYRKSYVFAIKTTGKILKIIPTWKKLRKKDKDYDYALRGAEAGLTNKKFVTIDSRIDLGFKGEEKRELTGFDKNIFKKAKELKTW